MAVLCGIEPPSAATNGQPLLRSQKENRAEISLKNLSPQEREEFAASDLKEWSQIKSRDGVNIWNPTEAEELRQLFPTRIMRSRTIRQWKQPVGGMRKAESRRCVAGQDDPDLEELCRTYELAAPTAGSESLKFAAQIIASLRLEVHLLDIANAFIQGAKLERPKGRLFVEAPPDGLPGLAPGSLIELIRPAYGLNDAPTSWNREVSASLRSQGWVPLESDPCIMVLRDPKMKVPVKWDGQAVTARDLGIGGILVLHVDGLLFGGHAERLWGSVKDLESRFESGNWNSGQGEYLGVYRTQREDYPIELGMGGYAKKIQPIKVASGLADEVPALPHQVKAMRESMGELGWLAKQLRGDLSTQVSLGQQSMPNPTVKDLKRVNNAVRRAKQFADTAVVFPSTPINQLAFSMHSDPSLCNARKKGTQAGYVTGATTRDLDNNRSAVWVPIRWKSGRLKRLVTSTLSGEAQGFMQGLRELEWVMVQVHEILFWRTDFYSRENYLPTTPSVGITDCKSLFDVMMSKTVANVRDREAGLDTFVCRQKSPMC